MKRFAPATDRNREPIAAVLREVLPERGTLLEIASGSGEHAVYFAGQFPAIRWQPTDPDPAALASIEAWRDESGLANLLSPLRLDASAETWPVTSADAILCVNMVHISPWAATEGLMRGAGRLLADGAPLVLYGPYRRAGVPTAPPNEPSDQSPRPSNPDGGLPDREAAAAAAARRGLRLERAIEMPANNLTIVFRA